MAPDDFIMTIDSDDEPEPPKEKKQGTLKADEVQLDPEFVFDLSGDPYQDPADEFHDVDDLVKKGSKPVRCVLSERFAF